MLNVHFQLNSKATHFWAYVYIKVSLFWCEDLALEVCPSILDALIYHEDTVPYRKGSHVVINKLREGHYWKERNEPKCLVLTEDKLDETVIMV